MTIRKKKGSFIVQRLVRLTFGFDDVFFRRETEIEASRIQAFLVFNLLTRNLFFRAAAKMTFKHGLRTSPV